MKSTRKTADKYATESHKKADEILAELCVFTRSLEEIRSEAAQALENIKSTYKKRITQAKKDIESLEKALKRLAKKHRAVFFDGQDRVDLTNGALIFSIERRVKKARGVLEKLKEHGFTEEIKIAESVDWDKLEKWTDERLFLVGTERKPEEKFEYELKTEGRRLKVEGGR